MKPFLDVYSNLEELMEKYVFNPELFVYYQLKKNNIKIFPIEWDYKINWHHDGLLNAWWRREQSIELTTENFEYFLQLKSTSYQVIVRDFLSNRNKKYKIINVSNKHYLSV